MKSLINIACFVLLINIIACGDIFSKQRNIYDKYYLLESEVGRNIYSLSYKLDENSFVERVPEPVLKYAVVLDRYLIAQSNSQEGNQAYYVINIQNDSPYADKEKFLVGIFSEFDFHKWQSKEGLHLSFTLVK